MGTSSSQIQDGWISQRKASVVAISSDPTKSWLVVTNADGSDVWKIDCVYKTRDIDDYTQTTYTYICKQSASGTRQIARITNATNKFEYAYGASDYNTAFTDRATLTYWNVA